MYIFFEVIVVTYSSKTYVKENTLLNSVVFIPLKNRAHLWKLFPLHIVKNSDYSITFV
jgi:hypothetical protein